MNILIVNDDSVHAPGIALLAQAAKELGTVTVVAPASQCSAMSQRITIHGKLKVRPAADFPVDVQAWQVDGTPADSVKAALHHILKEKPQVVLSGINAGWNVAYDIAHSGTLGAAFEAAMYGIPAIALSNAHGAELDPAAKLLPELLRELIQTPAPAGTVWNVNFPKGEARGILRDRTVAAVPLFREWYIPSTLADGETELAIAGEPLEDPAQAPAGSDLEAVLRGYVSVGAVKCVVL